VLAQFFEQLGAEHHIPIFAAFLPQKILGAITG